MVILPATVTAILLVLALTVAGPERVRLLLTLMASTQLLKPIPRRPNRWKIHSLSGANSPQN